VNLLMLVWSWSLWCLHRASMLGAVWALPLVARSLDVFFLWCAAAFGDDYIRWPGPLGSAHKAAVKAAQLTPNVLLGWDDLMRERAPVRVLVAVARVSDERPLWASVVRVAASIGVNVALAFALACGAALALPVLLALVLTEAVFALVEAARGRVSPP